MAWRILTIILAVNFLMVSGLVLAQSNFIPSSCTDLNNCTFDKIFGLDDETDSLFNKLINFAVLKLAVPLTTIAIVYAGVIIVSNPANSSKREEGKRVLYIAVWGLIITLAAYLIIKTIVNFLDSGAYPIKLG